MKKTAISLLLALAMVLGLVLVAAPAAEAATHANHCVCAGKTKGVGDHETCTEITEWTALTQASWNALQEQYQDNEKHNSVLLPSGNYYLAEDVTIEGAMLSNAEDAEIVICLNGYTLTGATENGAGVLRGNTVVVTKGTISITDCSADNKGAIKSRNGAPTQPGTIQVLGDARSTLNIYAGNIYPADLLFTGGGASVRVAKGNFNLYGGVIYGGKSKSIGCTVTIASTNFVMYGGIIKAGTIEAGGTGNALFIDGKALEGHVDIYGGIIENGTDSFGITSGIYLRHIDSTLHEYYVTIHGIDNDVIVAEGKGAPDQLRADFSKLDADLQCEKLAETECTNSDGTTFKVTTYQISKKATTPETPETPETPSNPETADSFSFVVLGLAMVMGVVGMVALLPKKETV